MEIERKFLVHRLPDGFEEQRHAILKQAYLSFGEGDTPEVRVRSILEEGKIEYVITEKGDGTFVREECERRITEDEYIQMRKKALTDDVEKERFYIPISGSLIAELDIYAKGLSGLMTVEVEFDSAASALEFTPPDWFGEEITENKEYKNKALARNGLPSTFKG